MARSPGSGSRRVLITGVTGQDGWYLARRLLGEGYDVHGLVRHAHQIPPVQAEHPGMVVHLGDLAVPGDVERAIAECRPDHIYNLAGGTSVARSWHEPVASAEVLGVGALRVLAAAAALQEELGRQVRVLQASSAEIFGDPSTAPQNEDTPVAPVTPYGAAKAFAHRMVQMYRQRGLHATNTIHYNHESPRRPDTFVARKITRAAIQIERGQQDVLVLGNIDVTRDWGFAGDHVDAMVMALEAGQPGDFVVATGDGRTVRDFVRAAFRAVGIEDYERCLRLDPSLYRPADPTALVGDPARIRALGWSPKVSFEQLVRLMVDSDLEALA